MDNSPLRLLPLELKLDIYERVLYAEEGVKVTLNKPVSEKKRLSMDAYASQAHTLAIRSTCKEIANETAGLVFKVNNSWSFVQMDDDSAAWGKRVRQWCQNAGDKCLNRARTVQFDIGRWDSRPKRCPRGSVTKILYQQIGSMQQNLPKQLRQCEQNFKLRIKWSSGVKMADGSRDRLSPITLVVPMWTDFSRIKAPLLNNIDHAKTQLHKYDYLGHQLSADEGESHCNSSPDFVKQFKKKIVPELDSLERLVAEIEFSSCIIFYSDQKRKRLEEHAFDAQESDESD